VPGACVGGGLCRASGASFAAATVSGVAGLLMSMDAGRGIAPSGRRIRKALLDSSVPPQPGRVEMAGTYLAGRLDVSRAVDSLLAASAPMPTGEENLSVSSLPEDGKQAPLPKAEIRAPDKPAKAPVTVESTALVPAHCGCGGSEGKCSCTSQERKLPLVYAIGNLGVSFSSLARRDSIWRSLNEGRKKDFRPITDQTLQELFKDKPYEAQSVVWTLSRSEAPMYAIVPSGAFVAETYKWIVTEWADPDVQFVAVPGIVAGSVTLDDGLVVDAIVPERRGLTNWQISRYVDAPRKAWKEAKPELPENKFDKELNRFLGKITFSIRNSGRLPGERAINAAATNAFNLSPIIIEAGSEGLSFRDVTVERSPFHRPGSDCYDVLLTFFDPSARYERAPLRARFTIDVSDTVPVPIGEPVSWYEY
jgi:cyanobactin maturation PatA/PatG family protease